MHKLPKKIYFITFLYPLVCVGLQPHIGHYKMTMGYSQKDTGILNIEGKSIDDGGLNFERNLRGVIESYSIDSPLIKSLDARRLDEHAINLQKIYLKRAILKKKEEEHEIRSPSQLINTIFSFGKKGIALQRYKGLGEMNPDQLWETTLDPSVRSLLQVKISRIDDANNIFDTLMGDKVAPRREFIQDRALTVVNLDT